MSFNKARWSFNELAISLGMSLSDVRIFKTKWFQKWVAIQGRGKSGGVRTLIAYQVKYKTFFIYGFAKNKRANINDKELEALQVIESNLLSLDDNMLDHLINESELEEVQDHE